MNAREQLRALYEDLERLQTALDSVDQAIVSFDSREAETDDAPHAWFQDRILQHTSALLTRDLYGELDRDGLWRHGWERAKRLVFTFDEEAYFYLNPEVAESFFMGRTRSGLQHWLTNGRREHRSGGPSAKVPARGRVDGPAGLNIYGFLSAISGLGTAARSVKKAVEASGAAAEIFDLPNWEAAARKAGNVARGRYRTNLIFQNADVLPLFARTYGQELLKGRYNIAHCVWELPALRADWSENLRYVDEIWTPSEFNRAAYQAATPLPVRVIPYTIEGLERLATMGRQELGLPEGVFLFSYVFDVSSGFERKNPSALIDAFRVEFGNSRDVFLLLKCFNSKYNPERMELLRRLTDSCNIGLVEETWSTEQIHSLHKVTDCFVSPHRGEGFGLNLAETMYFGNAVVATGYGANVDFVDETNSYLASYRLVEIPEPIGPYQRGNVWADVNREELARLMRRAFEDTEERRRKGVAAARTIHERYSAEAVARLIRERLAEVDQPCVQHPPRPKRFVPKGTPARAWAEMRRLKWAPRISVITPVYNVDAEWLRRCVESVRAQYYPYWELCLCDDGSTREDTRVALATFQGVDPRIKVIWETQNRGIASSSNRAAEFATGEWLAMLDDDDELAPNALLEVARELERRPDLDVLYTDEDKIDSQGRFCDHYHKPDWSPEHLQSVMYMLHLLAVRKKMFLKVGGFRAEYSGAQDYDLALRLAGVTNRIGHIPKVLYHWRIIEGSAAKEVDAKPAALEAGRRALEDFVRREKLPATVEPGLLPGLFRVKYRVVGQPKASLVIVAGNQKVELPERGDVVLVENFARSIVEKTDYANYEIVVAHDGNLSEETVGSLERLGCRLAEYPGPRRPFNFAHKANWSLRQARSELAVLLNDDMEVSQREWLGALLEYAQQPWIGAVGGRLIYADGRLQHSGIVLGVNGGAAHLYHGFPRGFVGYNAITHIVRNYSAVTGACLAIKMSLFEKIGGFDEAYGVDYNDIDFCLSLMDAGYRVVYTPYSELYHFEAQSLRRMGQNAEEVARFWKKWAKYLAADPHYNVNLSRKRLDCALRGSGG
jgi:GT2 family glycosyltransferase/glycosyltransferase involved in cell wall biosynthesis